MATSIQYSRWSSATDELFREWGKAISDGIRAVGLVQTGDTGQIDWETVTAPETGGSTIGTSVGYEIWRFDDALQDTHPVILKLEYGTRGGSGNAATVPPAMWVTIGQATDGAGTIVDVLAPRRRWDSGLQLGTAAGANQLENEPIYISSDGSSLCVAPRSRDKNVTIEHLMVGAFIVDRSRDAAGNPTAAGGVILTEGRGRIVDSPTWGAVNTSAAPAQMHAWTYAGDYVMGDAPVILPDYINSPGLREGDSSLSNGDRAPIFPMIVTVPGHAPWQVLAAVSVAAGDAANGPFTATTLGRLRNYRSIPVTQSHNRWATGQRGAYTGLCILWED